MNYVKIMLNSLFSNSIKWCFIALNILCKYFLNKKKKNSFISRMFIFIIIENSYYLNVKLLIQFNL